MDEAMKKTEITTGVSIPANCQHPTPNVECNAINPREPECDCRWCVFNAQFNKADE